MYKIRNNRVRVLLVVALILSAITSAIMCPENVYAIDAPDDITIRSVEVFRNLITDDIANYDQLYVVHYNLEYAAYPTDYTVRDAFIFKLLDTDGVTLLGTQLAYAYANSGYGQGVVAFYFAAADAPTWGGNLTVRITGNPVAFSTIPTYDFGLSATNYNSTDDHTTNQDELALHILSISEYLENEWLIALTSEQDTGTTLSSSGEKYFRTSIRNIQAMAPDLFFLQSQSVNTDKRVWGSTLTEFYETRLNGVDGIPGTADDNWIRVAMQRPFDELNISYTLGIGLIVVLLCVILIWQSHKRFQTAMPGYMASLIVVMCAGILTMGFTIVAIVCLILAIGGGWLLYMRRSQG